jgi:hypothetical protein
LAPEVAVPDRISPRARELARDTAIEAARRFMAAELRLERAVLRGATNPIDLEFTQADALQTLRDSLAAERALRGRRG